MSLLKVLSLPAPFGPPVGGSASFLSKSRMQLSCNAVEKTMLSLKNAKREVEKTNTRPRLFTLLAFSLLPILSQD